MQAVSLYVPSHKSSHKKPMFVVTVLRTSNYVIITTTQAGRQSLESDKKEWLRGIYIAGLESLSFPDYEEKYEND